MVSLVRSYVHPISGAGMTNYACAMQLVYSPGVVYGHEEAKRVRHDRHNFTACLRSNCQGLYKREKPASFRCRYARPARLEDCLPACVTPSHRLYHTYGRRPQSASAAERPWHRVATR